MWTKDSAPRSHETSTNAFGPTVVSPRDVASTLLKSPTPLCNRRPRRWRARRPAAPVPPKRRVYFRCIFSVCSVYFRCLFGVFSVYFQTRRFCRRVQRARIADRRRRLTYKFRWILRMPSETGPNDGCCALARSWGSRTTVPSFRLGEGSSVACFGRESVPEVCILPCSATYPKGLLSERVAGSWRRSRPAAAARRSRPRRALHGPESPAPPPMKIQKSRSSELRDVSCGRFFFSHFGRDSTMTRTVWYLQNSGRSSDPDHSSKFNASFKTWNAANPATRRRPSATAHTAHTAKIGAWRSVGRPTVRSPTQSCDPFGISEHCPKSESDARGRLEATSRDRERDA